MTPGYFIMGMLRCIIFKMTSDQAMMCDIMTQVVWSKKMNFDVACLMKFHNFPFEYSSLYSLGFLC